MSKEVEILHCVSINCPDTSYYVVNNIAAFSGLEDIAIGHSDLFYKEEMKTWHSASAAGWL